MNNNNKKPLLSEEQISVVENWINGSSDTIVQRKKSIALDTTNASIIPFEFQDFSEK